MTGIRPVELRHRGRVEVHGLLWRGVLASRQVRARVVRCWTPGSIVISDGSVVALIWPEPRASREPWDGEPLLALAGMWCTCPLIDDEIPSGSPGAVLYPVGSELRVWRVAEQRRVDCGDWLELGLTEVPVRSLAPPAQELTAPPESAPVTRADIDLSPLPAKALELMRALNSDEGSSAQSDVERTGGAALWVRWALAVTRWVSGRLRRGQGERATNKASNKPTPKNAQTMAPRKEHPLRRWLNGVESWLHRLTQRTALGRMLASDQAEYLHKLLDDLDKGDLMAALQRAIPLGGDGDSSGRPAWRTPTARDQLAPSVRSARSSSSVTMGPDLYQTLRRKYREAAEALEEQGAYREAAFVWADLLNDVHSAVALLERHGELAYAARLAEGRGLSSEIVVRLLWLAGDLERAVALARRDDLFAAVIGRLHKEGRSADAQSLRLIWAGRMASAGQYLRAVEVLWPAEAYRAVASRWIDTGIRQGGRVAGVLRIKKLGYLPDNDVLDGILEGFLEDDLSAAAMAHALVGQTSSPWMVVAARAALRWHTLHGEPDSNLYDRLLSISGDRAWRIDGLPPQRRALGGEVCVAEHDVGSTCAHDVLVLPNGDLLVALGELGMRLMNRSGAVLCHFDHPAHRLVAGDEGALVLALHRIGVHEGVSMCQVYKVDTAARTIAAWIRVELCCWCERYDGDSWFVAVPGDADRTDLVAVDVTVEGYDAVWRMRDVGAQVLCVGLQVLGLDDAERRVLAVVADDQGCELWTWRRRSMRLVARDPVKSVALRDCSMDDGFALHDGASLCWPPGDVKGLADVPAPAGRFSRERYPVAEEDGVRVRLPYSEGVEYIFRGATRVHIRRHHLGESGSTFTYIDDRGRLICDGATRVDLRL